MISIIIISIMSGCLITHAYYEWRSSKLQSLDPLFRLKMSAASRRTDSQLVGRFRDQDLGC